MTITFKSVLKLAKGNVLPELNSVIFDGQSAMAVTAMSWVAGVPCPQPGLTEPVVVPGKAIAAHLARSRHLIVTPDGLTNGQGLVTPFGKGPKWRDSMALDLLPHKPSGTEVVFGMQLDALDRTLIAASKNDIRYYLNGVLFDLNEGTLVGTNGHALHLHRGALNVKVPQLNKEVRTEVVVPRDPLDWLVHSANATAQVTVFDLPKTVEEVGKVVPSLLLHCGDGFVWVTRPVDCRYPDWRKVMEVPQGPTMTLNPAELADKLLALQKVAKANNGGKALKFYPVVVDYERQMMHLDGDVAANGFAMGCKIKGLDDDEVRATGALGLWHGVNSEYLIDLADCVTAKAGWRLNMAGGVRHGAMAVKDGAFEGLVMPCKTGLPDGRILPVETVAPGPETGPEVAPGPETGPEVATGPETGQEVATGPESGPEVATGPDFEPCPAAVGALVAQVLGVAAKPAKPATKGRKVARPEPVAA